MKRICILLCLCLVAFAAYSQGQDDPRQMLWASLDARDWQAVAKYATQCIAKYQKENDVGAFVFYDVLAHVIMSREQDESIEETNVALRSMFLGQPILLGGFATDKGDSPHKIYIDQSRGEFSYYGRYFVPPSNPSSPSEKVLTNMVANYTGTINLSDYLGMMCDVRGKLKDIYISNADDGYIQMNLVLQDATIEVNTGY